MAAQALYLKYRPRTFDEVVGQEAITRTLRNALRQGRIRHAYLLVGPRGTGKTTTARLLAKAVNCLSEEADRPCNHCTICQAINDGRLLDLIEIDAASNRGIDEIRDLRDKVGFRPNEARYKVYVLDEAHMLTGPAFNALLKTLEEPPPHVIFTLVTTDAHEIPATIASRCQRFDFRRISIQDVVGRLAHIAAEEGLRVEPAALELIARHSTGAMRDAISLLDQLASYGEEIALDQVQMVLGTSTNEAAARLAHALVEADAAGGLAFINQAVADGTDPRQLAREMVEYLRGLLLLKKGAGTRLLNATAEQAAEMEEIANRLPLGELLEAIRLFNAAAMDYKSGLQTIPQLPLEMALVQSLQSAQPASETTPRPAGPAPAAAARPSASEVPQRAQAAATPVPGPARPTSEAPSDPPRTVGDRPTVAVAPAESAGSELSLDQVQRQWPEIIAAVQVRNRTTAAVLRSNCQPIDLVADMVIITAPSGILRDKLDDPQRKVEVQDAMLSVLGVPCRLKLVLPGEYTPRPQPDAPGLDERTIDEITRWAAERGGQTSIIQS